MLYKSGFSKETEPIGCIWKKTILRNWLIQLWSLASPKSEVQAGRLEIEVRVDIRVLGQNLYGRPAGWKLRQDFYMSGEVEFHILQETSVFASPGNFN